MFSKEKELHVLFNNGGVMVPPIEQLTEDGYDLQFGTNVLGHYYFTMLLLPALFAGTKTSGDGKARVVNTSSSTHMFSNMNFDTFADGPARKKAGTQTLYSQSKHVRVVRFVCVYDLSDVLALL
jgi:retinol dehydrogenase-12